MSTRLVTSSSVHLRWQGRIQVDNSWPPIMIKSCDSWRKILGSSHEFLNPGSQGWVLSAFFSCHQNKEQEKGFELANEVHIELPLLNMSHQDLRTGIFLGGLINDDIIWDLTTRLLTALHFEKMLSKLRRDEDYPPHHGRTRRQMQTDRCKSGALYPIIPTRLNLNL